MRLIVKTWRDLQNPNAGATTVKALLNPGSLIIFWPQNVGGGGRGREWEGREACGKPCLYNCKS